jgi:protein-S-isoprenylcysteine O-methyltransferase Ste14
MALKPPRIMPPVYLLVCVLAMLGLAWWYPLRHGLWGPWRWAGVAPIAIGLGLVVWVAMLFSRRHTTIKPGEVSTSLLTAGPFRFSRNPIYLGMVFVLIGTAIALDSLTPWFVVPFFIALSTLNVIPVDESMLAEAFGDEYASYRTRVRRWL